MILSSRLLQTTARLDHAMPSKIKVGGAGHTIKKNKKGDIIVDHADSAKAGKYDKINLTKKAGAKTIKEGVKATKDWHKKNPHKKGK